MKSPDPEVQRLRSAVLSELASTWSVGRALLEHEASTTAPIAGLFNEREVLSLCLVGEFGERVTATALSKVFGVHHSQVGKMVDKLVKNKLLEKSGMAVSRKSGRGTPLHLTSGAQSTWERLKLEMGRRFAYLIEDFTPEQLDQLHKLYQAMHHAAKRRFEERVFPKRPLLSL